MIIASSGRTGELSVRYRNAASAQPSKPPPTAPHRPGLGTGPPKAGTGGDWGLESLAEGGDWGLESPPKAGIGGGLGT